MWQNIDETRTDSAHYSVMRKLPHENGMDALRAMFPDGKANDLNFVLFSTSGVHGTYNTIEEAERFLIGKDADGVADGVEEVTFLIVHPRLVALRYSVCYPANESDIDYLKRLRASSHAVVAQIGMPD